MELIWPGNISWEDLELKSSESYPVISSYGYKENKVLWVTS